MSAIKLEAVIYCSGRPDILQITLPRNLKHWDKATVLALRPDTQCRQIAEQLGVPFAVASGSMLGSAMSSLNLLEWATFLDDDILLPANFKKIFTMRRWDLDTLYSSTRRRCSPADGLKLLQMNKQAPASRARNIDCVFGDREYRGYFQLFHAQSSSLWFKNSDDSLSLRWPSDKKCLIDLGVIQIIPPPQKH